MCLSMLGSSRTKTQVLPICLRPPSFPADQRLTGPISILWGKRGRSDREGLIVTKNLIFLQACKQLCQEAPQAFLFLRPSHFSELRWNESSALRFQRTCCVEEQHNNNRKLHVFCNLNPFPIQMFSLDPFQSDTRNKILTFILYLHIFLRKFCSEELWNRNLCQHCKTGRPHPPTVMTHRNVK